MTRLDCIILSENFANPFNHGILSTPVLKNALVRDRDLTRTSFKNFHTEVAVALKLPPDALTRRRAQRAHAISLGSNS